MTDAFFDNWTTQLRKGLLEMCILSVIRSERLYGYDIVKRLRQIEGLVISEGTIYPILSRLKKEGLMDTYLEESPEGPARKYYRLTARGKAMLGKMKTVWSNITAGVQSARGLKGTGE